jgi:cation diffusion facilitator family transporter
MHTDNLSRWTHDHAFDAGNAAGERGTRLVLWITLAAMVVEIVAGFWFNSMALQADGWHMSSHAVAIGLSTFAYATARRYASDPRFAFGTWKLEVLGSFASAIVLLGVAVLMFAGSVTRLLTPQPVQYQEAMLVAVLGLVVNLVCAMILGKAHHHDSDHHHHDHAHPHHHDLNLKSAYVHVIADAATSVLAILALAGGWACGWSWLDPAMGIVGAVLVAVWAKGLIRDTSKILLDREMDHAVVDEIRDVLEQADDPAHTRITDLHVWRVGKRGYSLAATLVTHDATLTPYAVRQQLSVHEEIVHSTIEIHVCENHHD